MKLTRSFSYDAPLGQVVAMLRYPGFRDRVARETGATSSVTKVTDTGDVIEVLTEQDQRAVGVPAFAQKFLGETTRVIIRQTWWGNDADYVIDTPGSPVSINGRLTVSAADRTTVVTYDLDITCGLPVVGTTLEPVMSDLVDKNLGTEHAVGRAWVAGNV